MPADRLLSTLLRSLQTYTDQQDTPRLLSTAASLLTTLTNPLNITLLTSQLLTAPALWARPEGLRTCLRFLGLFHSAAVRVLENHHAAKHGPSKSALGPQTQVPPSVPSLSMDEWVRAVVKGADEHSARWKHLLVVGGLLIGLQANAEEREISSRLKATLEEALVQATNLALQEVRDGDPLGGPCVALVLNHAFVVLSDAERTRLDYDALLPVLVGTAFFSSEGFESAYFLGALDIDVAQVPEKKFNWPKKSSSYKQVEQISMRPLVTSMGPLSRLMSYAAENVRDPWLIQTMMDDLAGFAKALTTQWRQNKLSEIDASEEGMFLHEEALKMTVPTLWKVLKSALFAIVIVLRGVMGRILGDGALAVDGVAPVIVAQTLHTLRNLYFVSSRLGAHSFSQYTFVYLTAIDILSQYPIQADAFLKSIQPLSLGQIPRHPLDRCLDLYFLNTAEHFTLVLSPQTNEELLVAAATPYVAAGGNRNLLSIFEAAHSVMLAVLSAPQSAHTTAKHLPFYIDALFAVFPHNLSPRQFRLAFKTLMRVTAPPSPLAASQPDLPAILLDLVHNRALDAPTEPLKSDTVAPTHAANAAAAAEPDTPPLSEQAVLILTLLDALPFLPVSLLEEWLPLAAQLVNVVQDPALRSTCRRRFWEVMVSGEMDPERAAACVAWWGTRGGRETVLFGDGDGEGRMMSGALVGEEGKARESRL